MFVVAMESQCMKTIMKHLVDKRDVILSDHKARCKLFAVIPVQLANSDFSCTKLALQKISVSRKYKSSQQISTIL